MSFPRSTGPVRTLPCAPQSTLILHLSSFTEGVLKGQSATPIFGAAIELAGTDVILHIYLLPKNTGLGGLLCVCSFIPPSFSFLGTLSPLFSVLLWIAVAVCTSLLFFFPKPVGIRPFLVSVMLRSIYTIGLGPTLILLGAANVSIVNLVVYKNARLSPTHPIALTVVENAICLSQSVMTLCSFQGKRWFAAACVVALGFLSSLPSKHQPGRPALLRFLLFLWCHHRSAKIEIWTGTAPL